MEAGTLSGCPVAVPSAPLCVDPATYVFAFSMCGCAAVCAEARYSLPVCRAVCAVDCTVEARFWVAEPSCAWLLNSDYGHMSYSAICAVVKAPYLSSRVCAVCEVLRLLNSRSSSVAGHALSRLDVKFALVRSLSCGAAQFALSLELIYCGDNLRLDLLQGGGCPVNTDNPTYIH